MKSLFLFLIMSLSLSAFAQQKNYINFNKVHENMRGLLRDDYRSIVRHTLKSETGVTNQTFVEEVKLLKAIKKACLKAPREMDTCFILAAGADTDNFTLIDMDEVAACSELSAESQKRASVCMLAVWPRVD